MFISLMLFDIAKNSFTGAITDGEKDCLKLTLRFKKYEIFSCPKIYLPYIIIILIR